MNQRKIYKILDYFDHEQEVAIKTNSTGDKQFTCTVSKIAPTAHRDANGNIASSSNVQFDTEVALKDTWR